MGLAGQHRYSWALSSNSIWRFRSSFSNLLCSKSSSISTALFVSQMSQLSKQPLTSNPGVGSDDVSTKENFFCATVEILLVLSNNPASINCLSTCVNASCRMFLESGCAITCVATVPMGITANVAAVSLEVSAFCSRAALALPMFSTSRRFMSVARTPLGMVEISPRELKGLLVTRVSAAESMTRRSIESMTNFTV